MPFHTPHIRHDLWGALVLLTWPSLQPVLDTMAARREKEEGQQMSAKQFYRERCALSIPKGPAIHDQEAGDKRLRARFKDAFIQIEVSVTDCPTYCFFLSSSHILFAGHHP